MNNKLLLASILRTMARYKLRTFFMSFGIVVGVAALVVTRSMGSGAEKAMLDNIARLFSASSILVRAGGGHMNTPQDGPTATLKIDDLEAIEDALDQVIAWDPMQILPGQDISYQGKSRQVSVYGHSERAETVWGRSVAAGEFFTAADVRSAARVALLGTKTAEALFGDQDPLGQQIRIGTVFFRVKGILAPFGLDPHGNDRDDEVQVPVTTLMRRLANVDYLWGAKLIVDDPDRVEATAARVTEILERRHAIAPDEPADFSLITPALIKKMVGQANRIFKVFLPVAAGVALIVAAIVIANIMLISVRERIAEIGLRKAVGATDRQISLQFFAEAVAVTLCSGLLGAGLGAALVAVAASTSGVPLVLTPDGVALGLVAASVVGVVAGTLPARKAAHLDPIEALR